VGFSVLCVTLGILLFLGTLSPWCRLFQRAPTGAATACNGPSKELLLAVAPENCQFPLAWVMYNHIQTIYGNTCTGMKKHWLTLLTLWRSHRP